MHKTHITAILENLHEGKKLLELLVIQLHGITPMNRNLRMKTMESISSVCILMSTYNGLKYIKEQLDSLLAQYGVTLKIVIRDDGSTDATMDILSEYAKRNKSIILLKGQNCGAEESFNNLCRYALKNINTDYYAFCDQDDVWDADKLRIAVDKLRQYDENKPNLYFSNLRMVDEELNFINDMYVPEEVFIKKSKTLVQIFTYGCTCVFNRTALEYYCKPLRQNTYHDNWIYCLCSYLGNVYYDQIGHIMYRQHGNNLSGSHSKGLPLLLTRVKRLLKGNLGHDFETMATQLLQFENEIDSGDLKIIRQVSSYRNNIFTLLQLFFSTSYRCGHFYKDLCIRYRIITHSL